MQNGSRLDRKTSFVYSKGVEVRSQVLDEKTPNELPIAESPGPGGWPRTRTEEQFTVLVSYIAELLGVIRRLEDQCRQTSDVRILGRTMVAGLAHDLRNPLAVIGSCAQFCLENEQLTPVTRQYLEMIRENSKEANRFLKQFLEFSKVNLSFKSLDLNALITSSWEMAKLDARPQEITFQAHLAKDLPEFFGDPDKIERILVNLFLNAIQAVSHNSGERAVTVTTCLLQSQDNVEISIIDNGPGIPKDIREKLFTPFFTTREGGTGLGLHICQHFVEEHKGRIVIGQCRKRGTKVTVTLPITQAIKASTNT